MHLLLFSRQDIPACGFAIPVLLRICGCLQENSDQADRQQCHSTGELVAVCMRIQIRQIVSNATAPENL